MLRLVIALLFTMTTLGRVDAAEKHLFEQRLLFDVFLGEDKIGSHSFRLTRTGPLQTVVSEADFEVKLLMFTAFRYVHASEELWRDGCLRAIDTRTDSNGDAYAVQGRSNSDEFVLTTGEGERRIEGCVRSFAYWDRSLLMKDTLLNAQTGQSESVKLERLGPGQLAIGNAEVPVERLALTGDNINITLYYDAAVGEWLGLESRLENGRVLIYRRASPWPIVTAQSAPSPQD